MCTHKYFIVEAKTSIASIKCHENPLSSLTGQVRSRRLSPRPVRATTQHKSLYFCICVLMMVGFFFKKTSHSIHQCKNSRHWIFKARDSSLEENNNIWTLKSVRIMTLSVVRVVSCTLNFALHLSVLECTKAPFREVMMSAGEHSFCHISMIIAWMDTLFFTCCEKKLKFKSITWYQEPTM